MNTESKRIIKVLIILSTMLISLVVYLSYFEIFQSSKVVVHSYNKRQWLDEETVIRGSIIDRRGKLLVYSEKKDNGARVYKYGNLYSHIIGYSYKEYGKSGLEATYNKMLIGANYNPIRDITETITGSKEKGNNLILTIDHNLQEYTQEMLKGHKGAIVVLNPRNGEIYAMVSKPDFNPSALRENWENISQDEGSPLLNRATMGLYTPGSVFKVVTATSVLQSQEISTDFQCDGYINIDGYVLKDYGGKAHGDISLDKALEVSCNVAFSKMGLELGGDRLRLTAQKYMFNDVIPFDLVTKSSIFPKDTMTKPELGATAIGQGRILTTPLNMGLVAAAIANDGVIMKPIIVREVITPEGKTVKGSKSEILRRVISSTDATKIKNMMVQVVKEGTGTRASMPNITVAGKTGTAQNEKEKEHAWFIGFAPADNPRIAIAIVLENEGSTGGSSAAPIAKQILNRALKGYK